MAANRMSFQCPALLLCAPGSGHGKTSITAGLARLHQRQGRRVRCFKVGPDFIDPSILLRACATPVYNLDLWMMGADRCRALLWEAAQDADLILIEGAMGLIDGTPSTADVAQTFGVPIVPVINAASMAQTFAMIVHGVTTFRPGLQVAGVVANRVASARHEELLRMELSPALPLTIVKRSDAATIPERHLGLQLGNEISDLDARLNQLADLLENTPLAQLPPPVVFLPPQQTSAITPLLKNVSIAVASDPAFSFLYRENLEWLQRMGATLHLFSPLNDAAIPTVDAIYLPGGYPELHAEALEASKQIATQIREHVKAGKPLLAECGGMLYLADTLSDLDSKKHAMLGLLPGEVSMGKRLTALGPQQLDIDATTMRGHTFHYSSFATSLPPAWRAVTPDDRSGEAVYRLGSIVASYVHWYFPSNPPLIASWLRGNVSAYE
jgi:cobyrinic acid a,c-diamide synthase